MIIIKLHDHYLMGICLNLLLTFTIDVYAYLSVENTVSIKSCSMLVRPYGVWTSKIGPKTQL